VGHPARVRTAAPAVRAGTVVALAAAREPAGSPLRREPDRPAGMSSTRCRRSSLRRMEERNPRLSPDGLAPSRDLLPRALVVLLGAAAVVVVVAGVRAAGWLVAPVFTALVIVIAVSPVQDWLRRRGWPAWLTTTVLVVLVYGVLALLTLGIVVSLGRLAGLVPQYTEQAAEVVGDASAGLSRLGIGPDQLRGLEAGPAQQLEDGDVGRLGRHDRGQDRHRLGRLPAGQEQLGAEELEVQVDVGHGGPPLRRGHNAPRAAALPAVHGAGSSG